MRRMACAVVGLTGALYGFEAAACSYVVSPPFVAAPRDGEQGVPVNATLTLGINVYSGDAGLGDLTLARVESDGGLSSIPFDAELVQTRGTMMHSMRVTPVSPLDPNTVFAVRWPTGWTDGGWTDQGVTLSSFTTGAGADNAPPGAPVGVGFTAAGFLPDAGGGCGGPGGPVVIVEADLPDAGEGVAYFARIGAARIFSAYGAGKVTGFAACTSAGAPEYNFNINTGPATVTVWTEDRAGNASPEVVVATNIDCAAVLDGGPGNPPGGDAGTGAPDAGDGASPDQPDGASGCSATGPGAASAAMLVTALFALRLRRRSRFSGRHRER